MISTSSQKSNEVTLHGFPQSWEGYFPSQPIPFHHPTLQILQETRLHRILCTQNKWEGTFPWQDALCTMSLAPCSEEHAGLRIRLHLHRTNSNVSDGYTPALLKELQKPLGSSLCIQVPKSTWMFACFVKTHSKKSRKYTLSHRSLSPKTGAIPTGFWSFSQVGKSARKIIKYHH